MSEFAKVRGGDRREQVIEELRALIAKQAAQLAQQAARIAELELALAKGTKEFGHVLQAAVERPDESSVQTHKARPS